MGESWDNTPSNKYVQSVHAVNTMDTSYDSYLNNNIGDVRSRAYVNPIILNCAAAYSNTCNVVVPKKIHINPNFKGHRTFLPNGKGHKEGSTVHINPYFGRSSVVGPRSEQLQSVQLHPYMKLINIATEEEKRISESNEKGLVNDYKQRGNIVLEEYSLGNNSGSKQFTKIANSSPAAVSKGATLNMPSLQSKSQSNKIINSIDIMGESLNIKTRHKIVHVNNLKAKAHTIHNNVNFKRELLNRYKLVNVGKSERHINKNSKNYFPSRNRSLESNAVKEEREQMFAGNLKPLKMKHSLRRNSSVNGITNSIKTKYIYQNKTLALCPKKRPINSQVNSKHKLDKRGMTSKTCHNEKKLLTKTVAHHKVKTVLCLWKLPFGMHKYHNNFIWRKQENVENDIRRIKKAFPNRTVVKIGGIMYKSSSNKLTRAKDKKREERSASDRTFVASKMRHHIVYVRGEKFLLDSSGKTLIRQPEVVNVTSCNKSLLRRIDLGGVTFIPKSNNVLIRTNTHQARQLVHSAKQRSIALLHHLRKRNNMPCMIYQRFGICRRHKKGVCIYVHDAKNIDLCKKFLKGECLNSNCLLSHNAVKEKMATCHFFLKGKCNKENCPYLHVKVNKKAVICRDFLQGFCNLGQNCTKRHVHRCPEFDEKGVCSRSSSCPYPHKTSAKRKPKNSKGYKMTKFKLTKRMPPAGNVERKENLQEKIGCKMVKKNSSRTKCEISKKRKMKVEVRQLQVPLTEEAGNDSIEECIPKRVKLTDLPLFIPLNTK